MGPNAGSYFNEARHARLAADDAAREVRRDRVGHDRARHAGQGVQERAGPMRRTAACRSSCRRMRSSISHSTARKGCSAASAATRSCSSSAPRGSASALKQVGTILEGENALYVRAGTKDVPEVTFIAAPGRRRQRGGDPRPRAEPLLEGARRSAEADDDRGIPARVIGAGPIAVRYANVKGRLVITDLPSGIVFAKNGGKTLADSQEYQDAAASSGAAGLAPGRSLRRHPQHDPGASTGSAARGFRPRSQRNLKPLRSAVEYAVSRSHELQVTFFLRIK